MPLAKCSSPGLKPVYEGYFADPFVWKHENTYYAIGTGAREAAGHTVGKIFPILRSDDFENWRLLGNALAVPTSNPGNTYWAPAVASDSNNFYLYYSVGQGDKNHQLRVAVSSEPGGPYRDQGQPLMEPTHPPFCIDPHPFQDMDGRWYLFYARDFLDYSQNTRVGTALMVRRLKNMTALESDAHVVLRAHSDWQRFEAARPMYGAVWDWHTLEGPCLVRHENRYFCFYSGGRWEDESYGVDYGVAETILGPYSDSGNEAGPRVLRTRPGQLIGPGHNSWIIGPDGAEYLAFHAWNEAMTLRQMYLARLHWTSAGPRLRLPDPKG